MTWRSLMIATVPFAALPPIAMVQHLPQGGDSYFVPAQAVMEGRQRLQPNTNRAHGGEDVVVRAIGPWAHLRQGTIEQNMIFHVMDHALEAQMTGRSSQAPLR